MMSLYGTDQTQVEKGPRKLVPFPIRKRQPHVELFFDVNIYAHLFRT